MTLDDKGKKPWWNRNNKNQLNLIALVMKPKHTCLTKVTAVVPLQKQSILGCIRSSLSIVLNALQNDSFNEVSISKLCPLSTISAEVLGASSAWSKQLSSEFMLSVKEKVLRIKISFWLKLFTSQLVLSFRGSKSLTFLATMWPLGPWPSNTPQKTVSALYAKFWGKYIVS